LCAAATSQGYWRGDKAHGRGKLIYASGDWYDGEWVSGKKHGYGELHYANGDVFKGDWADDQANGKGSLAFANGNVFEGGWKDNKVSRVLWTISQRHGFGVFTCAADGYRYEGEWFANRRHGLGTIFLPNGDRFTGMWRDGKLDGPVEYVFAEGSGWNEPDF
jgi:hypothetical protein